MGSVTMNMGTLVIRTDASARIGTGHIIRCLALAQAWQREGGQAVFLSRCVSNALRKRITAEGFDFISLDKSHPDPFDIDFTLAEVDRLKNRNMELKTWIVVDGYHFDADYQKIIKEAGNKLLWIDDYGHASHYYADLILNQNISADEAFYAHREPYTRLLLGARYALLRREFKSWQGWKRKIPSIARKVLVTMGGGDPNNVTRKVLQALKNIDMPILEVRIVIGPANPNLELLKKEMAGEPSLQILNNIADMSELMAWADIAVTAGGSTSWELAYMGLPRLILMMAENQRRNAEALDRENIGINLGWYQDVSVEKITSQCKDLMMNSEIRSLMSQRGRNLVDGRGGQRLCNIIAGETLTLRPVLPEDCERVWKWANENSVRTVSFSDAIIPWEEHVRWFEERINRPYFYIVLNQDDRPVGQIRFDQKQGETFISVMIDSHFRNRGYGAALIRLGCEKVFFSSDIMAIHAYMKLDNEASRMAFVKAGFKELPKTVYQGYPAYHFILSKC